MPFLSFVPLEPSKIYYRLIDKIILTKITFIFVKEKDSPIDKEEHYQLNFF